MEPVAELDEDDAHVGGHGQQHLPEVLGLDAAALLLGDAQGQAVELGQALDELGGFLAEALGDLLVGDAAVLLHVVQEGGDERRLVELEAGDELRHLEGMGDVGVAGAAHLAGMALIGKRVGITNEPDPIRGKVGPNLIEEAGDGRGLGGTLEDAHALSRWADSASILAGDPTRPGGTA